MTLKRSTMLLAVIFAAVAGTLADSSNTYSSYRLPKSISPEHYNLRVYTHLGDERGFVFHGHVAIRFLCHEDTDSVVLHSKNLTLLERQVSLREVSSDAPQKALPEIDVKSVEYVTQHDYAVFHVSTPLKKGARYELTIPFESNLGTGLLGYYRSSYLDKRTKQKIWLAVTQFEPTYARQAFPCFDEPEMKATFNISLAHHKRYVALSNMPVNRTVPVDNMADWVLDEFNTTVPMSTYLVAYTVNDFEYREATTTEPGDVVFKIWARRDAIDQVDYARDIGPRVTRFYEDYFHQKFPLPKIDMIAIPDFASGAMENWGLITYRETALLYHPNISTASNKHRVASVIAHELAHQWFGNLVTMRWWTDLWLNEGFATYVASLGVDYLHPEWYSLEEESVSNTLDIFKFDALQSSHPISVEIGHPNQISQIFDAISYEKGSIVIRMMHLFLTEETFRDGVSRYLRRHAYGNAEQDNLWEALTEEAHANGVLPDFIDVKKVMDSWTLQTGYPIITVTRNYDANSAEITQTRFVSSEVPAEQNVTDYCWWIPLTYTTAKELDFNDTLPKGWMECHNASGNEKQVKIMDDLPDSEHWVIFNIQLAGLYKVRYDKANYRLIIAQLNGPSYDAIGLLNRAQLIDDAMDLAWTGQQNYGIAFAMINYLRQEAEYIPWKSALTNLNSLNRILKRTPLYDIFKSYVQYILEPIYERLEVFNTTRKSTDRLDAIKQLTLIASWACRFEVGDCVNRSVELFARWMNESNPDANNPVPIDLRPVVYCNAIRQGNDTQWNFLWRRYLQSNVGAEKIMIIGSLACTRQLWLVERFLLWSLNSTSGVRKQDATILFSSVSRNDAGFNAAKNFFLTRADEIYDYLSPDTSRLSRYIKPLAEQMFSAQEVQELNELIKKKTALFEKANQGVKQALETAQTNNKWAETNINKMERLLPMLTSRSASDHLLNLIDNF
ncbi:aminopeptidase N-like [Anopheles maculipalpis]|uniref:aminopeptidase N-like n=1 Tax=Anopheles maculipalpis TaxID=1496333 RepID=UPI0021598A10|nr:aminopeptidase N-like [Anopheles maculipalpis]